MNMATGGKWRIFYRWSGKISIRYDNDGIRIRRGDSARRNFDRITTWKQFSLTESGICMRDGNYVDNLISNNAIEQEQKEDDFNFSALR